MGKHKSKSKNDHSVEADIGLGLNERFDVDGRAFVCMDCHSKVVKANLRRAQLLSAKAADAIEEVAWLAEHDAVKADADSEPVRALLQSLVEVVAATVAAVRVHADRLDEVEGEVGCLSSDMLDIHPDYQDDVPVAA